MKKNEFVSLVAERTDMSKKDTEKVIDAAFAAIGDLMMQGDKLVLSGFGSFETKVRAARSGRNPAHGRGDRDRTGDAAGVQGRPHTQGQGERKMRLDKYLKVSRLIKRRTVANDACDAARITVNGKSAKASYQVKTGDIIEIAFGQRTMKVEVLEIAEHALKADAAGMYREIL